jgi:outer membrane receptor for ferrienterochelin and colicins
MMQMQKMCWVAVALIFFSFMSAAGQTVNLSGIVTEEKTGDPLVGASVYLKGTTMGTVTNRKGEFVLKKVKPGEYTLVISSIGYHREKKTLVLDKDSLGMHYALQAAPHSMGEVVVTGTATPHHLKHAPVQTELINSHQIKQVAPANFTDLMANISPSFDFSPGTMGAFMQLNGLGNDYILVLMNGKRLYGDIGGQTDLNRINPANVQRIEVVKGASSALYGSEAIAGVINIITKQPKQKFYLSNSSRIGANGEWVQNNKLNLNLGKFSSSTSFDRKQTDGWQLSDYEMDDENLIETDAMAQNASRDYTLSQRFTYAPTQNLEVFLDASIYQRDIERPVTVKKYGYLYDDFNYAVGAKYLLKKGNYIQAYWNSDNFIYSYKYNQDYKAHEEGDELIQTEQLRDALHVKSVFRVLNAQTITVGAEYVNEELESDGRLVGEKATAYTNALYVQDEIEFLEKVTFVAGLRFVNHKEFGSAVTPKVAALYTLGHFNLRATYAGGFKAPTLKELYYRYEKRGRLYLGNVNLNPQVSDYYAASVEYNASKFMASVTAYQNQVDNLIAYKTIETTAEDAVSGVKMTRQHYNISEAQTQGIDFLFNVNIGWGVNLGGGYSYVDAQNLTDDIPLERVAQNYGNVRAGYHHQWKGYRFNASINGRFQDEKYFKDEPNAKAFNLWKLTTIHRFSLDKPVDLAVTLGVDNIFDYVDDSPYGLNYGTLSPGRTFFLGINIEFAK